MKIKELERDSAGMLPAFAWPGGYPIVYVDGDGETLCAKCATKSLDDETEFERMKPQAFDVYYEGPSVFCSDCNVEIESAYGDPTEEGETK